MEKDEQEQEELFQKFEVAGVECEELDDIVHELLSQEASTINNSGLREQFEYVYKYDKKWLEGFLKNR